MVFDLVDLRLFALVVEAGSITRGAERAGLALASASARIRAMEERAGLMLLERGRRGVLPTAAGTALFHHARAMARQLEEMRGDLAAFAKGLKGRVRLAANTASLLDRLPEALAGFLAAHPSVDLDLAEMPSIEVVRAIGLERADIGIAADHADTSGLETHPFHDDRLVLAVPAGHPLAEAGMVDFAEALAFDHIGLAAESALQRHLADHAARAGGRLRLRARVGGLDLVCRMVAAGAGLAFVPEAAARQCAAGPRLLLLPLRDAWTRRRLLLVTRRGTPLSAHAARLFDHLLASRDQAAARPSLSSSSASDALE